ncbi:hypothetical protein SNEBB_001813 [Seison nebaliae]|nr:hypothetical protein SNEBB_001813 [Seison nebaliae]
MESNIGSESSRLSVTVLKLKSLLNELRKKKNINGNLSRVQQESNASIICLAEANINSNAMSPTSANDEENNYSLIEENDHSGKYEAIDIFWNNSSMNNYVIIDGNCSRTGRIFQLILNLKNRCENEMLSLFPFDTTIQIYRKIGQGAFGNVYEAAWIIDLSVLFSSYYLRNYEECLMKELKFLLECYLMSEYEMNRKHFQSNNFQTNYKRRRSKSLFNTNQLENGYRLFRKKKLKVRIAIKQLHSTMKLSRNALQQSILNEQHVVGLLHQNVVRTMHLIHPLINHLSPVSYRNPMSTTTNRSRRPKSSTTTIISNTSRLNSPDTVNSPLCDSSISTKRDSNYISDFMSDLTNDNRSSFNSSQYRSSLSYNGRFSTPESYLWKNECKTPKFWSLLDQFDLSRSYIMICELAGEHSLLTLLNDFILMPTIDCITRLRWTVDILNGLNFLHSNEQMRILHLDIKPSNIIVTSNLIPGMGRCKLADFGCSVVIENLRNKGVVLPIVPNRSTSATTGTYLYRAPELLRGKPPTPAADIYSCGMTFWHMLTRDLPFIGENPHVTVFKVVAEEYRPAFPPNWPPSFTTRKNYQYSSVTLYNADEIEDFHFHETLTNPQNKTIDEEKPSEESKIIKNKIFENNLSLTAAQRQQHYRDNNIFVNNSFNVNQQFDVPDPTDIRRNSVLPTRKLISNFFNKKKVNYRSLSHFEMGKCISSQNHLLMTLNEEINELHFFHSNHQFQSSIRAKWWYINAENEYKNIIETTWRSCPNRRPTISSLLHTINNLITQYYKIKVYV